ncbi:porin [Aquabacter sp. CN5-332]|uniref:porin n=1 Tax=Aquabacter sp. CN5-332 TaxID=3156608 RepID=UPI0032B47CA8
MKMVKSLLLGSAAGLAAMTGAQAADLPVKAKAVEYVKVCAAYGAGYYYVPGTDTCLRVGGYVRFDTYINAVGTFNPAISSAGATIFNGPGGGLGGYPFTTNDSSDYLTRARAVVDLDARTATDYGVLRSYARFGVQWDSSASAGSPAGNSAYFERAFIQFAGFTFGYTQSFFDTGINYMLTTPYAGSNTWTSAIAYTAQFGNGFSATIALEDAANRTTGVQQTAALGTFTNTTTLAGFTGLAYTNYQEGQQAPDIVANLRLDQAWGTAMLSGALHQVGGVTPLNAGGGPFLGAQGSDTWGWAVGGSVEFKLPMLSPGDSLYIQANYADGALNYLGLSGTAQGRATGLGSIDLNSNLNTGDGAFYPLADAIWNGTGYSKESGWAIQGQYRHYWVPNLRSALYGGYAKVEVPGNAIFTPAQISFAGAGSGLAAFNGGYNVEIWQVGLNTIWSPVKNLDLGLEVLYSKVDGSLPLTAASVSSSATAPTATTSAAVFGGSSDVWSGGFRAQRNF